MLKKQNRVDYVHALQQACQTAFNVLSMRKLDGAIIRVKVSDFQIVTRKTVQ